MQRIILMTCCSVLICGCARRTETGSSWPRRPLMQAVFENSLMYRNLSKQVYESAVIDDMEVDRNWSATGIAKISYTTERAKDGKRSLRFQTSMRDEEKVKANRSADRTSIPTGGTTSALLKLDKPQDWSRLNRISLWVFVHPTSMQTYAFTIRFFCEGEPMGALAPNPFNFVEDLKPGEWNHVVWEIPEFKRDKVTGFEIFEWLRGHDPEDEGIVTYDFDQIEVQRVDAEPYEGWEVSPGKIAFQHVGYLPSGEKVALASGVSETQFELVDATSNAAAASFQVKSLSTRRGSFQVLDFTSFTRPGRYFLRCGKVATRPFPISDDFWYGVIQKVVNYYYGERCGFDVPGVHHVCHQDVQGTHEGQTKVINGGWHDAGDLCQGSHRTDIGVYAMLQMYDQLRQRNVRPDLRERVLEEARWGLDWLLKTRFGKGYRITWWTLRIYTDNKLGTSDDLVVPARNIVYENFLFSAVASYAARILKDVDPQRATQSLLAAEEDYRTTLQGRSDWTAARRDEVALGTLAAVELYRTTGKQSYAEEAARFGRLLLQCQEQRFVDDIPLTGYFYESAKRQRIAHDNHESFEWSPLMALRALCETFPGHLDWMEWYGAAVLHSEYFYRQGSVISEPYRHIPNSVWRRSELDGMVEALKSRESNFWAEPVPNRTLAPEEALEKFNAGVRLSENHRLLVFPIPGERSFHGNTNVQLSGTVALREAAQLRNEPAIENLARRQLQWVFGGNPFSQTLMYGEGYDYTQLWAPSSGNLVGAIPVGIDSLHNDSPFWPSAVHYTYREQWVEPAGRLFWSLAYLGMPALVTGSAAQGATFRELHTGITDKIPSGKFSLKMAPGDYTIEYGGATKRIALLGGGCYELSLDAHKTVEVSLSARSARPRMIEVTAHLRGAGTHNLELRAFNGSVSRPQAEVNLTGGGEQLVGWNLKVADDAKPWVVVVIADGDTGGKTELFGTVRKLQAIH